MATKVGDKVRVYNSDKDEYFDAEVIRVYDEKTYLKERYTDQGQPIPYWETGDNNDTLIDVQFPGGRISKAYFEVALKRYAE